MNQVFTIYSVFFLTAALVSVFVAFLAWQRRPAKAAKELTLLMVAAGFWAFWIIFETASPTVAGKIFWAKIGYIGAVTTPVLYLIFILRFTGKDKYLSWKHILMLFIVPAITLLLAITNEKHYLVWSGFSAISTKTNMMEYYHGTWFWIGYMSYNYLLYVVATFSLFQFIIRNTMTFRTQGWVVFLAGLCPWVASAVYIIGLNPVPGLDLTPISIILSGVLLVYAIFYIRFLDLAPVARETLVETLTDGILALDGQNRIQDINQAALSYLGIPHKNIIGSPLGSSGASIAQLLEAAIDHKPVDQIEIADGNGTKIFRIIKKVIHNQQGSRLVVIRDISDQVARQREIIAMEERYRNMFSMFRLMADNMLDMLWAKDLEKRFIFTNKSVCEKLLQATDTDEPIGKNDMFFALRERQSHPERNDWFTFGELCQDSDQVVINSQKPEHFDEFGNVNGKFLFLDVRKAPIFNENGVMIGVVGSGRDVTLQKKTEDDIHKRDKLLDAIAKATALLVQGENLMESINGAIEIIGKATEANRVYIFQNHYDTQYQMPLMSQRFEWTDGSVEPQIDFEELQNLPYEINLPRWFNELSAGKVIVGNVREFPVSERAILEVQAIKSILVTPVFIDKSFWGFIGFDECHKEREWTPTEERLLTAAANTIGAAYLRKKNQDQLIAAKEKAEESDRLKSSFLANMSHEIRTPMNGILGFASLLKEQKLTGDEQKEYISIIEKSGARMLNVINDIVDISKIESGLMEVSVFPTNINEQIEYLYTFFKPEVESKGMLLFINTPLPEKDSIIITDREKVYAILANLVKNAIKYTEEGSIEFGYIPKYPPAGKAGTLAGKRLQGEAGANPGANPGSEFAELEFYVKDTGIGIPEDRQQAVFDRFVQADIGDKRAFQGAGLGLSITKAYVEMLGGSIWVVSELGKGSTFYFTLPYYTGDKEKNEAKNIVSADGTGNQTIPPNLGFKILIVEDDEISERLLRTAIRMISKEILRARTGVEAIETCRKNPDIDLVLMDIKMPEMNGYEATKLIRQFNKEVVIIAQSAFALVGDREKALEAGCNDYIPKPIKKEVLLGKLKKYGMA